jgi:Fe-S-cluster containining protein
MDATNDAAQDLCAGCGLCCEGSLFDHVPLLPEEPQGLRALGFTIEMQGDQAVFKLPCGFHTGTGCSVYEARPQTCRGFRCATLRALDSGAIDRDEAHRRTREAKGAVALLRAHLQEGESFLSLRRRSDVGPSTSPELKLALVLHNTMLDRYFRNPTPDADAPRAA